MNHLNKMPHTSYSYGSRKSRRHDTSPSRQDSFKQLSILLILVHLPYPLVLHASLRMYAYLSNSSRLFQAAVHTTNTCSSPVSSCSPRKSKNVCILSMANLRFPYFQLHSEQIATEPLMFLRYQSTLRDN